MTIFEAVILGIIQGLTEFLPVSSSGHFVLGEYFLGLKESDDVTFVVLLHFGTLLSVVIYFRKRILEILYAIKLGISGNIVKVAKENYKVKEAIFLLTASIPAAVIGLAFEDFFEEAFSNLLGVSIALMVTGTILYLSEKAKLGTKRLNSTNTFLIGCAQAAAIIPGISRSGSTICTGLFLGIKKEMAAEFSFLLSLPVILGATILKVGGMIGANYTTHELIAFTIGTIASFVSGYFAIVLVMDTIKKKKFSYFSYYCWAVGLFGIIYFGFFLP